MGGPRRLRRADQGRPARSLRQPAAPPLPGLWRPRRVPAARRPLPRARGGRRRTAPRRGRGQRTGACGGHGAMIRLTVLGSCGTYPAAGRACSGYLLEATAAGQTLRVWVDAGSGTLANLLRYTSRNPGMPPIPVYGPSGWAEHMRAFLQLRSNDPFELRDDAIAQAFETHELHDGQRVNLGPLELTAVATVHSVETYALRAAADGQVLAYSADTGPCEALGQLAAAAGLFVCEAAWPEKRKGGHPAIHLTARLAGEWAERAGAERLVLTHLRPEADLQDALECARSAFGGAVDLAREGDVFQLGSG